MESLIIEIQHAFSAAGHPGEASWMKSYLRNQFEFSGIKSPERNKIQTQFYAQIKALSSSDQLAICHKLWDLNGREYKYFALEILKRHFKKPSEDLIDSIKFFITTESWWDTVDMLASNSLGVLIRTHPHLVLKMDEWIDDDNLWLRRSALIHQLKFRDQTDPQRLFLYCSKRMHESDLFIRKAIGWSLRQYSRTDPQAVLQFVRQNENQLSELSKKEALRLIL